ncbi:MAG: hypothetical protein AB7O65_09240 [Candidatus Korobacteraceae bacterium]
MTDRIGQLERRLERQFKQLTRMRTGSGVGDAVGNAALLVGGAAIGAMAMYIFDAQNGRRRRALARDRAFHILKELQWSARRKAQDLRKRTVGSVLEMRSQIRDSQELIDDDVLEQRVRAQVGHVVSHPGALEVRADSGRVMIRGPVLLGERKKIEHRMSQTRGVRECDIQVTEHANKDGIPGLQGETRFERRGSREVVR